MTNRSLRRLRSDESGLSHLEILGLLAFVVSLLAMVPFIREFAVNAIGVVFNQTDPDTGHINEFSTAMRGVAIAAGAVPVAVRAMVPDPVAALLTGIGATYPRSSFANA